MRPMLSILLVFLAPIICSADESTFSRSIPSQNGFAVDYGKHGPGDVLTLLVSPDAGCQISQAVLNPTPLGWKPGFVLVLSPTAAGTHTGKFGGTYGCTAGVGTPPEWSGTARVDACAERKSKFPATISINASSKQAAWLKTIEKWLQKLPLVKKASAAISITGSQADGTECCPGRSDRTDFVDYSGAGKGAITLVVHGGPPALDLPRLQVPIPGTDYAIAFVANVDVGVNGGGVVAITSTLTGRVGECSCATLTGSGSAQPQIVAQAKGAAGAELVDRATGEVLDSSAGLDINVSITASMSVNVDVMSQTGKSCEAETITACVTWPNLVFKFSVGAFGFLNINLPPYDLTEEIYSALGVKKTSCWPE